MENDINWDEKSIAKLPRTDRESLVRQLVTKLISEVNCKTCKKHHKQCVVNTNEIDELLEKTMRLACSSTEMRNFFDKKTCFSMFLEIAHCYYTHYTLNAHYLKQLYRLGILMIS